jgi:hypothetical protein
MMTSERSIDIDTMEDFMYTQLLVDFKNRDNFTNFCEIIDWELPCIVLLYYLSDLWENCLFQEKQF